MGREGPQLNAKAANVREGLQPKNKGKSASTNRIGLPKGSHNGAIRGVVIHEVHLTENQPFR